MNLLFRGRVGGKKLFYEYSHNPFFNTATKTKDLFSEIFFWTKIKGECLLFPIAVIQTDGISPK